MKLFYLFFLFILSSNVLAQSKTIRFNGQKSDQIKLEYLKTETRYRTETVPSTCTREIPYQEEECGYETKYRYECNWQPGYNDCRTVYDTECREETYYEKKCWRVPDNSDDGYDKVCERVPRTRTKCVDRPRQECNWVPGQNVCEDTPYQEYVCRTVTKIRYEDYPCMKDIQVPYEVELNVKTDIQIEYNDLSGQAQLDLNFQLNSNDQLELNLIDESQSPVFVKFDHLLKVETNGNEKTINGKVSIEFVEKSVVLAATTEEIKNVELRQNQLSFDLGKVYDQTLLNFQLKISRKAFILGRKTYVDEQYTSNQVDFIDLGEKTRVVLKFDKNLKLNKHKVELLIKSNLPKNIVNASSDNRNLEISEKINVIK